MNSWVYRLLSQGKRGLVRLCQLIGFAWHRRWILQKCQLLDARVILHYSPDFSGGAAAHIVGISQALPKFIHIVASKRGFVDLASQLAEGKDNLYLIEATFAPNDMAFIHKIEPTAVFNHVSWDLDPVAKNWFHERRRPVIVSFMHSRDVMHKLEPEHADKSVVFSRYLEDAQLEARYSPGDSAAVVQMPNCINESPLVELPLRGPLREGQFVVGNITNGAPWKHSADFLKVCETIEVPNVRFEFLGAAALHKRDRPQIPINIVPAFSLSVPDYLSGISVLMHRTRSDIAETWCRAVTEAMFAGVPVVAEKKGGIREQILHRRTGFLCENAKDFRHYIEALYADEDLYREISRNAREEAVARFGLQVCRRQLFRVLSQ